ncbi:MAG: N-acetylneuraminate synthase [bacterium]|nr:N-acetylneuraminate synthase [bacterium]
MALPYIIAEIGFNHEGDINLAKKMIKDAAEAGADAVKFQTFLATDIALPSSPHYEAIKSSELSLEDHLELAKAAKDNGIDFLSTPFSTRAVDLLEKVGVPAFKVASMDCTNKHLLGRIAETKKDIYLSTGMATLAEIAETLGFLKERTDAKVTLLHCLSLYPAKEQDLNLDIIPFLKSIFDVPLGYSDHYPGSKACLLAALLGAEVIETHFTHDVNRPGGDHSHSVDAAMLRRLVDDIRLFDTMKGSGQAVYNRPDGMWRDTFRRGLYFAGAMKEGDSLKESDLLFSRPVSQLGPNDLEIIKGKQLNADVKEYEPVDKRYFHG